MCAHRLNPWEFDDDVAPDEELPDYEAAGAATAPAYDSNGYDEPLLTYHLRQYDRRIQVFVPYGSLAKSSYRVTSNAFRFFSKKPDMEILYTSQDMRQRNIAEIAFDSNGPLPWCPRAHFDHRASDGATIRHELEAKDFTNWTLTLGERKYGWQLSTVPCSLVFSEQGSDITTARFMYSAFGTSAVRGAEIGKLTVFRDALTVTAEGIDQIVCSLMVAITHLKRLGRHYSNADGELVRAVSLTRASYPMHRMSSAGFSIT